MEETKRLYEAIVIISCKCSGEGISAIVDKLKKLIENEEGAQLESCNEWGKKRLAYLINKEAEAYYVLFNFVSDSKFPAEFSRICGITDGVLRSMVVKCVVKKKKAPKQSTKKVESAIAEEVHSAKSGVSAVLEEKGSVLEVSDDGSSPELIENVAEEV